MHQRSNPCPGQLQPPAPHAHSSVMPASTSTAPGSTRKRSLAPQTSPRDHLWIDVSSKDEHFGGYGTPQRRQHQQRQQHAVILPAYGRRLAKAVKRQKKQPAKQQQQRKGQAAPAKLLSAQGPGPQPAGASNAATAADAAATTGDHSDCAAKVKATYFSHGKIFAAERQALGELAQGVRQQEQSGIAVEAMFKEAQQVAAQQQCLLLIQKPKLLVSDLRSPPVVVQKAFLLPAGHQLSPAELQEALIPPGTNQPLSAADLKAEGAAAVNVMLMLSLSRQQAKLAGREAACTAMTPATLLELKLQLVAAVKWHLREAGVEWSPLLQQVKPVMVSGGKVTRPLTRHTGVTELAEAGLKL